MKKLKSNLKAFLLKWFPGLRGYRLLFRQGWAYEMFLWPLRYLPGSSVHWGPPRGIYKDVAQYNLRNPTQRIKELVLKKATTDTYKLPWSNSKIVTSYFKERINTHLIEKKVWVFKNARYVYGGPGTTITSDDKIFLPTSHLQYGRTYKSHQSLYRVRLPKMKTFKKVILMDTMKAASNYCHWLRDHLTRLFWLKQLGIDFSDYTLIASNGTADYCEQTRELLIGNGFNFKEWLFTEDFPHFFAEEIIAPPYVNIQIRNGILDIGELFFLRNLFLKPELKPSPGYDKIYVSRRKTAKRYTPEQSELAARLADYGVKEVFLEDLTVFEQATLFHNAGLIIGLHGAGFINLIFCKPGTRVIEIFGPNYIVSAYWSITEKLKLNYYAYCDDEFFGQDTHKYPHFAPTHFNVDNFFATFSKLDVLK